MRGRNIGVLVGLLALGGNATAAKVSPKVLGKAYVTAESVKDQSPEALSQLCEKMSPKAQLKRGADKHWMGNLVAFFRKPSVAGPITVWYYDKADKAAQKAHEAVDVKSVPSEEPRSVFAYSFDLNPELGFSKGQTYLIYVGQIINKRHVIYAKGEVVLQE